MDFVYKATELDYKIAADIIASCKFAEMDDLDQRCLETYDEFMNAVKCYAIIDFNGNGRIVYNNQVVENSNTWVDCGLMVINSRYLIPFDKLTKIFGEDVKIVWYNK